jgi:hypothetical protein
LHSESLFDLADPTVAGLPQAETTYTKAASALPRRLNLLISAP